MVALLLTALAAAPLHAATDRYDYDALGRLIRRVDDQNRATDYTYDASGNIMRVTGGAAAAPLSVTTATLGNLRQNESRQATITGAGLTGATLRTADSRLSVSEVVVSANAISFRLSVAANAPLGSQAIVVENAAGSATVGLNVIPVLAFAIQPTPITLPPDGIARRYTLMVSEPLADLASFSLSTTAPVIAKPATTALDLQPGTTQADLGMIGLSEGVTVLLLKSPSLVEPVESLVFVIPGAGNAANHSNRVLIHRGAPWSTASVDGFGNALSSLTVRRGSYPWSPASAGRDSVALRIQRWVPWAEKANGGQMLSPSLRIVRQ